MILVRRGRNRQWSAWVRFRFWGLTGWPLGRSGLVGEIQNENGNGSLRSGPYSRRHRSWFCFHGGIHYRYPSGMREDISKEKVSRVV